MARKKIDCPACGAAGMVHATRDLTYTYKGYTTTIPKVTAEWCKTCGESLTGSGETDRVMQAMASFQRQVNAAQGTPEFLGRVRRKLKLSQRKAGEVFGGGVNAFNRYESGSIEPPQALVQLFGILDKHPELLHEVGRTG